MLGMIVYADLLDQEPDLALLDTVAQSVAARGAVVAEREYRAVGRHGDCGSTHPPPPQPWCGAISTTFAPVSLTALYAEDDATRESRIALFTGTTDAFSSTTNGTFATDGASRGDREREQDQNRTSRPTSSKPPAGGRQPNRHRHRSSPSKASRRAKSRLQPRPRLIGAEAESPTPDGVIIVEGETPAPAPAATPPPAATSEETTSDPRTGAEQQSAQVFMTSALYAFPGDAEADAWLNAPARALVAGAAKGRERSPRSPDAPTLGDDSVDVRHPAADWRRRGDRQRIPHVQPRRRHHRGPRDRQHGPSSR